MKMIGELVNRLGLGQLCEEPKAVSGGLLHKMYRVMTTQGTYAVKVLNAEIMKRPTALQNMINSEKVAIALAGCVPVVAALELQGKQVQELEGAYYMIYPWVEGRSVFPGEIQKEHCEIIGDLLGRIHRMNVLVEGLEPEEDEAVLYPWEEYLWAAQKQVAMQESQEAETVDMQGLMERDLAAEPDELVEMERGLQVEQGMQAAEGQDELAKQERDLQVEQGMQAAEGQDKLAKQERDLQVEQGMQAAEGQNKLAEMEQGLQVKHDMQVSAGQDKQTAIVQSMKTAVDVQATRIQKVQNTSWIAQYEAALQDICAWNQAVCEAQKVLRATMVISHRDLDPKNVMWQGTQAFLIDWEAAGYVNPYQELLEIVNYWADDGQGGLVQEYAESIVAAYKKYHDLAQVSWSEVFAGSYAGMLGWLEYNLKRALGIEATGEEEVHLGAEQVDGTIRALYAYQEKQEMLWRLLTD